MWPDRCPISPPLKPVRGDIAAKAFPPVLQRAGHVACFAADEFFSARISNAETRRAYARAVGWFLEFYEREDVELVHVTLGLAGRFLRDLPVSAATKNQALLCRLQERWPGGQASRQCRFQAT